MLGPPLVIVVFFCIVSVGRPQAELAFKAAFKKIPNLLLCLTDLLIFATYFDTKTTKKYLD